MANWYVSSAGWTAVTAWAASTAYSVGDIRRQLATPTVGNERVWRCTTAGTSGGTEPTWTLTAGSTTTDNTAVWTEITGQAVYNGDGGGTTLAAPFARLLNAVTSGWAAAGDTVYLAGPTTSSGAHSETQSSAMTFNNSVSGTTSSPVKVISANLSSVPPTSLDAGAIVATTGASSISIYPQGLDLYGVAFKAGSASSAANIGIGTAGSGVTAINASFTNCTLQLVTTNTGSKILLGAAGSGNSRPTVLIFNNPAFILASTSQKVSLGNAIVEIDGGTYAATGSAPTIAFEGVLGAGTIAKIKGLDMTNITGTLVNSAITTNFLDLLLANCKVGSGVAMTTGANSGLGNCEFRMQLSDSSGTVNRIYKSNTNGAAQQETTVVRTGGASASLAVTTTSTATNSFPFVSDPVSIPNTTTGSPVTLRFEIAGAAARTNNEVWVEVDYMGSSGSPIVSTATSRISDPIFGTPANYTSSSETWGGSPSSKQYMEVTFTPQLAGSVTARLYVAKPSVTVYFDPLHS